MSELFGVSLSKKNLSMPIYDLNKKVYNKMPETKCLQCPGNKEGSVTAKCCRSFIPKVRYIEFLNIYNWMQENWNTKEYAEFLYSCFERFLTNEPVKPCPFLKPNNQCSCYEVRPLTCRWYGIVPPKQWKKRIPENKKMLKEDYPNKNIDKLSYKGLSIFNQCQNVKIEGTKNNYDDSWHQLERIEAELLKEQMAEDVNASYLPVHVYVLMFYYANMSSFGLELLDKLTALRKHGKPEDIKQFLQIIKEKLLDGVEDE